MQAPPEHITFSFRYLDPTKRKFSVADCEAGYFEMVMGRLKALSEKNRTEFLALPTLGKAWRVHRINWSDVSERSFGLPVELTADENAWQFTISKANGRVHGFLLGTKFFVRWFDPAHQLYNGSPN